ncbi:MAG TPA: TonB-dependent receptor [Vicinamibacterales bacterium]|jgi:carboxypeptidase family protein|nr:TonB-dependent receptor [Vicinamibacterales bacterium]
MQRLTIAGAFLGFLLIPSLLYAQASITGAVRDTSGAVLPGVSVEVSSPALIEKVRSVATNEAGQYRIENLRPGVYTVTFTLSGFATVKREAIELSGTFVATVNAEMRVGTVEETVTVTGESPVVDVQSSNRERVLSAEVINNAPVNRYPSFMASMIPGVNNSTVDVGGNNGSPTTGGGALTVHGSRATDLEMLRNGVSISTVETGSNTQGVPNMAVFAEMAVETATVSTEERGSGVRLNFIPREGGNTFSGLLISSFANEGMAGSNFTQSLRERGLRTPNNLKRSGEVNVAYGGPILRNRLWFFGTGLYNRTQNWVAGMFVNRNAFSPTSFAYDPDPNQQAFSDVLTRNGAGRVTWQVNAIHKLAFAYENTYTCQCSTATTAIVSAESGLPQRYWPNGGWNAEWTAPLTSHLLLEAVVYHRFINSRRTHPFGLPDVGDTLEDVFAYNVDAIARNLIGVQDQALGITHHATTVSNMRNKSHDTPFRVALSYVTGAHSYKFGLSDNIGSKQNLVMNFDAPYWYRFNNGDPNQITMNATPFLQSARLDADMGVYAQDRWTIRRATVSYGLRYDHFASSFPEQRIGPAPLVPNRNFTLPETDGVSWHDISPRAGVAYDLFGNGKTAVKGSFGKYVEGQALRGSDANVIFGDGLNPAQRVVTSATRSWSDRNVNFRPDCDLLNFAANGECGAMSNTDFGSLRPGSTYDPSILSGWGKRMYSWQFSGAVQHEIVRRMSVELSYFRRIYGNFNVVDDRARSASDFDVFSITAPGDPRLPDGGGYTIGGLYNVKPAMFSTPADNYITFAKNYGKQIEHWDGFDLILTARPHNAVNLQGGLSSGRTTIDNCEVAAQLPEMLTSFPVLNDVNTGAQFPAQYCHQQSPFLTQVKFLGSYEIPRIDVLISGALQSVPGPQVIGNFVATNAAIVPSLGRPLAGGTNNITVDVVPPGGMYGDRRNQFDLRLGKILRFGRTRTKVNLDINNVFNANPVLAENPSFAVFRQPASILPARIARLGVQFDF